MLTFDEIREIITMVNQSSIQQFELDHEDTKIVISKVNSKGTKEVSQYETGPCTSTMGTQGVMPEIVKKELQFEEGVTDSLTKLHKIVSPTVGTFYSAAEPGAEPFVAVGGLITVNTIVCVLEAMKLFNEVEAGVQGEIVEVLVKEGDFIEYGQPLFLVRMK